MQVVTYSRFNGVYFSEQGLGRRSAPRPTSCRNFEAGMLLLARRRHNGGGAGPVLLVGRQAYPAETVPQEKTTLLQACPKTSMITMW